MLGGKHVGILNTQLCIATIFAIGILTCLILCIGAFALLVYQPGDSVVRLVMWFCLAFVLVKLYPVIKRSLHASLKFSVTR